MKGSGPLLADFVAEVGPTGGGYLVMGGRLDPPAPTPSTQLQRYAMLRA
jgi:hypothetical protein